MGNNGEMIEKYWPINILVQPIEEKGREKTIYNIISYRSAPTAYAVQWSLCMAWQAIGTRGKIARLAVAMAPT